MQITIIHGQNHKGSTYHLAHSLAEKIGGEITEFFLPRDFNEFCIGCTNCFTDSETKCPHYEKLFPITKAADKADVIILASPVYVMHATGAMKALLDHYGYRFMVHRPEEKMFSKQAVCISTAAGAGMNSTNKDMADSTFFWGCARTYKFGAAVNETSWERVGDKKKRSYDKKLSALALKIKKRQGKVKPSLKTRVFFSVMRMMQKNGWNEADMKYWKEKGWLDNKRPWKNSGGAV
ncbi:MAG: NAD(P)H-dependent oxidoreductase [Firmicutes bacterium]|nr:NAD(P)H-dependent oxidoreductase [[Eubacterium] siraeum]MCM1487177.1 NAD(P)H-dependent oxidoreductase [Bacillota bacterium]